jgi:hypothetical protein
MSSCRSSLAPLLLDDLHPATVEIPITLARGASARLVPPCTAMHSAPKSLKAVYWKEGVQTPPYVHLQRLYSTIYPKPHPLSAIPARRGATGAPTLLGPYFRSILCRHSSHLYRRHALHASQPCAFHAFTYPLHAVLVCSIFTLHMLLRCVPAGSVEWRPIHPAFRCHNSRVLQDIEDTGKGAMSTLYYV